MNNYLLPIIVGVVVFTITMAILKSIVRAVLVGFLALIIFRIGWVYNADELFDRFKLKEVINEEYQEDIYDKYDSFSKKRDDKSVINSQNIDNNIKEKEEQIKKDLEEKLKEKKKGK